MRWSKERVWEWYNARPWIRGCNYMSADCANRIDQWQELGFEERFKTTEEEFKLMQSMGYNSIRIILEFVVWDEQHDGFMERFERYISLADKYGISCMVVLANDCMRPKSFEINNIGKQKVDLGYHGGRKNSQHGHQDEMGWHVLDDQMLAPRYFEMVREIVTKYKKDERIIIWNVYNEVGNSRREDVSLPNLKKMFDTVRGIDPCQPLTCEVWSAWEMYEDIPEAQRYGLENSDILSYHNYGSYLTNIRLIKELKEHGRPILNTEWLARGCGNTVQEMFPLFYLEKIGCYNWGFVAGKNQTYEPWNSIWEGYENDPNFKYDFTKWFHDLYRPNHRPYDPKEIELIKHFCELADRDFENSQHETSL
jgi:hypothetical protein